MPGNTFHYDIIIYELKVTYFWNDTMLLTLGMRQGFPSPGRFAPTQQHPPGREALQVRSVSQGVPPARLVRIYTLLGSIYACDLLGVNYYEKWVHNPLLNFSVHVKIDQIASVNMPT